MSGWLLYAILGTGSGALYAAVALSMVLTYRGSGVVNFAQVAMVTYPAFEYVSLRERGELVLPFIPWRQPIKIADSMSFWPAFLIALVMAALLGYIIELLVFRSLRDVDQVTKVIAAIGVSTAIRGLITVQFATGRGIAGSNRVKKILPDNTVRIFDVAVSVDRFWLVGIVGAIGVGLWAVYRWTRFGLATRGAAQSLHGAQLIGISPTRLSSLNWVLAGLVCGTVGVLAAPIGGVSLNGYTVFLAYALAAAMAAGLKSFSVATIAGIALGSFEAMSVRLKGQSWMPSILKGGFETALPFIVIVVALVIRGTTLPQRGVLLETRLTPAPRPRFNPWLLAPVLTATVLVLALGSSRWRLALTETIVVAVLSLSLVLMAGFVGQVTLAHFTFAGIAAYGTARLASAAHLGFPWSPLLAIAITTAVGALLSYPAVRIRGAQLVIITYSGAIALESVVFRNPKLTGVGTVVTTPEPKIFGWGFGPTSGEYPYKAFGFFALLVALGCTLIVVNLRRASTGRRMLAVRSNERAAAAAGVHVPRTKLLGATIGSFIAGCAGMLWAYKLLQFNSDVWVASKATDFISVVFVGGIAMVSGAYFAGTIAAGGVLLTLIGNGQGPAKWQLLVTGVGMVLVTVRFAGGLASFGPWVRRKWESRRVAT